MLCREWPTAPLSPAAQIAHFYCSLLLLTTTGANRHDTRHLVSLGAVSSSDLEIFFDVTQLFQYFRRPRGVYQMEDILYL
jgi:hypothetical protein